MLETEECDKPQVSAASQEGEKKGRRVKTLPKRGCHSEASGPL